MTTIRKLEASVINKIAAGEVVQRSSSAVKELIENSIDAGATSVTVIVKQGGLQLLQVQDNGHGISMKDLPLACERFATSKLTTFEDLKTVKTFGFRGEALASISYVANVQIISRTADSPCAYKALYRDGKLLSQTPCAGMIGTTITVEDLFYNMPARKQAYIKNANEEYQKILEILSKYSLEYSNQISFTCKKSGQSLPDLHCPKSSLIETMKTCYGNTIASELIDFTMKIDESISINEGASPVNSFIEESDGRPREERKLTFSITGKVSNPNYSSKKSIFIFFINHRLIDCPSMKRVIETVYQEILPRHTHPFIYFSIEIPFEFVDVNVHPTKREVHFLYEDFILDQMTTALKATLGNTTTSRTFAIQTLLPNQWSETSESLLEDQYKEGNENRGIAKRGRDAEEVTTPNNINVYPNKMIRVDHTNQKINSFFQQQPKPSSQVPVDTPTPQTNAVADSRLPKSIIDPCSCGCIDMNQFCGICEPSNSISSVPITSSSQLTTRMKELLRSLSSSSVGPIEPLLNSLKQSSDTAKERIIRESVYVGIINNKFSLLQHETKLLLFAHIPALKQIFYQLTVLQLGKLDELCLKPAIPIAPLLEAAFIQRDGDIKEGEVESFVKLLMENAEFLFRVFRIGIDKDGNLNLLPLLLYEIVPALYSLPIFLLDLVMILSSNLSEEETIHAVSLAISDLYNNFEIQEDNEEKQSKSEIEKQSGSDWSETSAGKRLFESIIFPAIKQYYFPTSQIRSSSDGGSNNPFLIEITSLPQLYKTFERC